MYIVWSVFFFNLHVYYVWNDNSKEFYQSEVRVNGVGMYEIRQAFNKKM